MIRLLPASLAGRALAILFFGLTLSHILSILVFTSEKMEVAVLTSEDELLERIAIFTRLLCDTPNTLHRPILAAMNHSGVRFDVVHRDPKDEHIDVANNEPLRQKLAGLVDRKDVNVRMLQVKEPDWNHEYGAVHRFLFWLEMGIIRAMHAEVIDQEWRALVQLPNQQHILFISRPTDNHVPLFRHATISVLIMSGTIFLFSLAMVQHMTRPWQRIVQAAEAFGEDVYTDPLPERGAVEIVQAARVFNRMNRRIREFIEERLQMIAAISHDLRTPLTQLRLMAEFVRNEADRQRMTITLDEMESMLTSTLSFAQDAVSTEAKQRVNLSSLLAAICHDLADATGSVYFEEREKLPYFCRPLAMKRALTNLIDNAITHGGNANVRIAMANHTVMIHIQDSGPGIPESEWDNVLKPFYRLELSRNRATGGAGLGLSIAASVIRDHGGKIIFSHLPAGGFVTSVVLPLVP